MYRGMKVYKVLALEIERIRRCNETSPPMREAAENAQNRIDRVMNTAPSGAGVDNGISLLQGDCFGKLKFSADYHHMNDVGFYDGWTEHTVTVKPSLTSDIEISISGRDRNGIKEHLHERFSAWLESEYAGA